MRERGVPQRRRAVALAYDAGDVAARRAPRVVAKGAGPVAEQILERARAAGVPINRSPELAAMLAEVDLDRSVPPALYLAIAELLAWVYRLEERGARAPD